MREWSLAVAIVEKVDHIGPILLTLWTYLWVSICVQHTIKQCIEYDFPVEQGGAVQDVHHQKQFWEMPIISVWNLIGFQNQLWVCDPTVKSLRSGYLWLGHLTNIRFWF